MSINNEWFSQRKESFDVQTGRYDWVKSLAVLKVRYSKGFAHGIHLFGTVAKRPGLTVESFHHGWARSRNRLNGCRSNQFDSVKVSNWAANNRTEDFGKCSGPVLVISRTGAFAWRFEIISSDSRILILHAYYSRRSLCPGENSSYTNNTPNVLLTLKRVFRTQPSLPLILTDLIRKLIKIMLSLTGKFKRSP